MQVNAATPRPGGGVSRGRGGSGGGGKLQHYSKMTQNTYSSLLYSCANYLYVICNLKGVAGVIEVCRLPTVTEATVQAGLEAAAGLSPQSLL